MKIGTKNVQFREGFKPKSLSEFTKVFGAITGATKSELKEAYNKLNGNTRTASKKAKSDKSEKSSKQDSV